MSDLFSQFEHFEGASGSDHQRSLGGQPAASNPFDVEIINDSVERSLKGDIDRPLDRKRQDFPILRRQDVTKFRIPSHITHIAVSNNLLSVAVLGNTIFRFDLKDNNPVEMCEIKREDDVRIHKMFQDPKGCHLLVFMESKEVYYVPRGGAKKSQPRLLPKFRNYMVESVAWNKKEQTEQATGPILLGTNGGVICELFSDIQKKTNFSEVYQLMTDMTGSTESVTGIHMEPFPPFGNSSNDNKWYVLVATPSRIYQFIGNVNPKAEIQFHDFFAFYSDSVKIQFQEIPGVLKDSKLCLWPAYSSGPPSSFAWLTGAGVYYSTLSFGDQIPGESLFIEKNLIPYSVVNETGDEIKPLEFNQKDVVLPIGLSLTEFHCVLLYRDKVVAICHLNNKKVFEESFNVRRHGPLYAMCTEPSGNIWCHAKINLVMFSTYKESRNIWKIYLDQGKFDLAQKYAKNNQQNLDTILIRQAEHYFEQGRYEDAAIVFSQSYLSFEQVTLKFMQINKKDALKLFLLRKLETLSKEDSTQKTMLSTWLTELFLNELGNLSDGGDINGYLKLQEEFHNFLETSYLKECFEDNSKTIYDLMSSHGATDDVIYFAKLMKDYDRVISHCIQQYKYEEALEIISDQAKIVLKIPDKSSRKAQFQKFAALYYKFSPVLVKHVPVKTVEAWIEAGRYLDPKRLIPALIQCDKPGEPLQKERNIAAIKYLEFCVNDLNSDVTSVHNFLISLYANSSADDHRKLRAYLVRQSEAGLTPNYDPQYALRLCLNKSLSTACVYIYASMGLYEESVDLALKTKDVELARRMIDRNTVVRKDSQLQKKLWLKIAQHVIKEEKNITRAMKFMNDCRVLKIEDILPFFSDVETIDQFKDAICESLQSYNSHIDQLKKEMDGATESAKNIRADIQEIRNKSILIKSDQKCNVCKGRLLTQAFYMFPCHHAFHRDCLAGEVAITSSSYEIAQMNSLIRSLDSQKEGKVRDDIKHQLDQLIASDCPYCGLIMIKSIAIPLVPLDNLDKLLDSWK